MTSTRFQPGQSGNLKGKPPGTRNKATRDLEALLDGEAERITRKAIDLALEGDTVALRLCLDRIAPVRRDRPIEFGLPAIESVADLPRATGALLAGVAEGAITPSEAAELARLVDAHVKAIEAVDFAARLARIEEAQR